MLNSEQIQKVRLVLASAGWNDVMHPALMGRRVMASKALELTRSERARSFAGTHFDTEDDVLRAMIRDCEWLIGCWNQEIFAAEHNRARDELDALNGGMMPQGASPANP